MRQNIFIKSMLRQPMRTGLLVVLISLASFAFFLRTVEFMTVRSEIIQRGSVFRAVGGIRATNYWADVSAGAELIQNSPFVGFTDRRTVVEAVLMDMYTPDFSGMWSGVPHENQPRITEALFTGYVVEVIPRRQSQLMGLSLQQSYIMEFTVFVVEVFGGRAEHIVPGQFLTLFGTIYNLSQHWTIPGPIPVPPDIDLEKFSGIQEWNTYLFRGARIVELGTVPSPHVVLPQVGFNNHLQLSQLTDGLWYMPAYQLPANNDFSAPEFSFIQDSIALLDHEKRTVQLLTTRDMSALPEFQRDAPFRLGWSLGEGGYLYRVTMGRQLNFDDYVSANPVAVVSNGFRWLTGLTVGDTFRISIPREQYVAGVLPAFHDIRVRSVPEEEPYHIIELEIVGLYMDHVRPWNLGTFNNSVIYVPHSVIPEGVTILPPQPGIIPGWYDDNYLPSSWFNFELANSRYEQEFVTIYGGLLNEMGFGLVFFESRSQEFWAAVDPMITIVLFNAIVFWAVLVLVLSLVVFLFLQQRRKELAVQRALGFTRLRLLKQILACALFFGLPGALIGGFIGWEYAMSLASETLLPLGHVLESAPQLNNTFALQEIAERMLGLPGYVYEPTVILSYLWFAGLGLIILAVLFGMVCGGTLYIYRLPVLEQLQGATVKLNKSQKQKISVDISHSPISTINNLELPAFRHVASSGMKLRGRWWFMFRHLTRSPGKSVLGVTIALFFILVFGWLSESIFQSQETVERLYDTTIVEAWAQSDIINRRSIDALRDSGFIENYFIEAAHDMSFIVPTAADGSFPDYWDEIIDYNHLLSFRNNWPVLNSLFAFNDLSLFIEENTLEGFDGLDIQFKPGFNPESDFVYTAGEPVPIIIAESISQRRGVYLGDYVYIGYTATTVHWVSGVPAQVVGIHNGHIMRAHTGDSFLMPSDKFEDMLGSIARFTDFRFTVRPEYNRQIAEVQEYLSQAATRYDSWLTLAFLDWILYAVVGVASQALLLLQLVYPIAIGASLFIAGGLNMLLMLQNAKKAAIMRVLGTGKGKTLAALVLEQLLLTVAGVTPGVIALFVMGIYFDMALVIAIGLYLGIVLCGALIGAFIIVNRPPLAMLQVKE